MTAKKKISLIETILTENIMQNKHFNVTVTDDYHTKLNDVKAMLEGLNITVHSVLEYVGVLSCEGTQQQLEAARLVKGVLAVEEEQQFHTCGPDQT